MPSLSRLAPALVGLVLCLPLPARAEEGETRTLTEQNFKVTLPSARWQFHDPTSDQASAGYRLGMAVRVGGGYALVFVRVVPTNGLPIDDLTQEVMDLYRNQLKEVVNARRMGGMLSGLQGTQVVVSGTGQDDQPMLFRAYTIEPGGKFHQMLFTFAGGAEAKLAREADALRRSYRLLQGAGPEEPPPADDGALGGGMDQPDTPDAGDWPAKGPGREGRTLVFPSHNLKWTLPEGSPFEWRAPAQDETAKEGQLVRAVATQAREGAKEGEATENVARVALWVRPTEPGFTPQRFVENEGLVQSITESVFDKVSYQATKRIPDLEIGNFRGAALQMVGTKGNAYVTFRVYSAALRGERYTWEVLMAGGREADDVFKGALKDLIAGVAFVELTEPVRGPLGIPGVPDHGAARGYGKGQEKALTSVGFAVDKPPEMSEINYDPQAVDPALRLAWESRSDDGQSYLYFDVSTWSLQTFRGSNTSEEDLVKQRESQWRQAAQDAATVAKGKDPWFKDRFGKGKGIGYEFRGTLAGAPFVERGYLVEYKKYLYWIRFQFGGKDAEKAMSKLAKQIEKDVKFN